MRLWHHSNRRSDLPKEGLAYKRLHTKKCFHAFGFWDSHSSRAGVRRLPGFCWLVGLCVTHISLPALALAVGFLMLLGRMWMITPERVSFLLLCSIGGLFIAQWMVQFFFRPKVTVRRTLPERVMAGAEFELLYEVVASETKGTPPLVLDNLPLSKGIKLLEKTPVIPAMAAGGRQKRKVHMRVDRRGVFLFPSARAEMSWPFGLWRVGCFGPHARDMLKVYPQFTPLDSMMLELGELRDAQGARQVEKAAHSHEFIGCRDYREGDDLRRLHPRSWARLGFPVVKEFEDFCLSRTALVADTWTGPGFSFKAGKRFEAQLSLLAALADYMARSDQLIELFAAGPELYRFQSEGHYAFMYEMLDILASLEQAEVPTLDTIVPLLLDELHSLRSVIVLLSSWDESRAERLQELRMSGLLTHVLLIGDQPCPDGVDLMVSPQNILEGRCTQL